MAAHVQETLFKGSENADELYRSDNVNERVTAQSLLCKSSIDEVDSRQLTAMLARRERAKYTKYFCVYHYDHVHDRLEAIKTA